MEYYGLFTEIKIAGIAFLLGVVISAAFRISSSMKAAFLSLVRAVSRLPKAVMTLSFGEILHGNNRSDPDFSRGKFGNVLSAFLTFVFFLSFLLFCYGTVDGEIRPHLFFATAFGFMTAWLAVPDGVFRVLAGAVYSVVSPCLFLLCKLLALAGVLLKEVLKRTVVSAIRNYREEIMKFRHGRMRKRKLKKPLGSAKRCFCRSFYHLTKNSVYVKI